MVRQARLGVAGQGEDRQGRAGWARTGVAGQGEDRQGTAGKDLQSKSAFIAVVLAAHILTAEEIPMAVELKALNRQLVTFTIIGTSPLIQHKWSEKAKKQMRDKKLGIKAGKVKDKLDMQKEFEDATYSTDNDEYGIPILAFKSALITAAHKDIGIEKTLVKKSLFVPCSDSGMVVPMQCDDPVMREDYVRVGMSGTDLRYRPEFRQWSVEITAEIEADALSVETLIILINRAGFGVGIGEWRPEKGGENGRFEIDATKPVDIEQVKPMEIRKHG